MSRAILARDDDGSVSGAEKYSQAMKEAYPPMPKVSLVKMDGSQRFIIYEPAGQFDAALEAFLKQASL